MHPEDKIAMVFRLDERGKYGRPETYSEKDAIPVHALPGELAIDLVTTFQD